MDLKKKIFRIAGYTACFIALITMLGGHWLALQSIAWTGMIMEYSKRNSLTTAIRETFDGKHPCSMCLKIREGRQQEEQQQKQAPLIKVEKMPDLISGDDQELSAVAFIGDRDAVPHVTRFHSDFVKTPPTPPPRGFLVAINLPISAVNRCGQPDATQMLFAPKVYNQGTIATRPLNPKFSA